MKTKKRIQSISSGSVSFSLPTKWEDLTEKELRYVYALKCIGFKPVELHSYCFIRFLGIKVYQRKEAGWGCRIWKGWRSKAFFLKTWEIQYFLNQLSFLDEPGTAVIHLPRIRKYYAVDKLLHGVPFIDYLKAENLYQGFLHTQDNDLLNKLAILLYRDKKGRKLRKMKLSSAELYGVFHWYYGLKNHYADKFPHFFQRAEVLDNQEEINVPDMAAIMNAQIRALTGGDITKEAEILNMDTWRALTELNEKAREVKELEEKR